MQTNSVIGIVGQDRCVVATDMIEAILLFNEQKNPEAFQVYTEAMDNNFFCPVISDTDKIKSLLILSNGQVYPSIFRVPTLSKRLEELGRDNITVTGCDKCIIPVDSIESILQLDDSESDEADKILLSSIESGVYHPLIKDKDKIKSLVILSNGQVYPSTFNVSTLSKRINSSK